MKPSFRSLLLGLDAAGSLNRVVFDACPMAVTEAGYRKCMDEMKGPRVHNCQFVFYTVTMPPSMEREFRKVMLIQAPFVVRCDTVRHDLNYHVLRSPIPDLLQWATSLIKQVLSGEEFYFDVYN